MDKEKQAVELFKRMADAIAERYLHEIAVIKLLHNNSPGFDILKNKLVELDNTLIDRGVWLIEMYKKEVSADAELLTADCQKIIKETIEQFVKKL